MIRQVTESNLEMFAILDLLINNWVCSLTTLNKSISSLQDLFRENNENKWLTVYDHYFRSSISEFDITRRRGPGARFWKHYR
jgi:hypothetical protein